MDEDTRKYWIRRGEKCLAFDWPPLTAEMYADYERTGTRRRFELPYHTRRQVVSTLVLAEGFENQGRFVLPLIEGLERICREPTWVLPAHRESLVRNDVEGGAPEHAIDIFAAETGNALAWVLYVFGEILPAIKPDVCDRVRDEIRCRIIEPYLNRNDFWWMGYGDDVEIGNWTTWCTSNCLGTVLLEEPDASRRLEALEKACFSLSRFLEQHGEDGGCDEGPMYWNFAGACVFDSLEMLYVASGGAFDVFRYPVIRNIATYICKVHIHDLHFVNFSDSPARVPVDAALIYRFGKRIGDGQMQELGARLFRLLEDFDPENTIRLKMYRALAALADDSAMRSLSREISHPKNVYLRKIQVMVAREHANTGTGLVLAVKGGHNQEGHNHNDVGNFVVYADGRPALVDVGMSEYSKTSFTDQRYELWALQSAYHNVPLVNDVMQKDGRAFRAGNARYLQEGHAVSLRLDLAHAYAEESGLELWERECILDRRLIEIRIEESFCFRQDRNNFELRFMASKCPRVWGHDVRLTLDGGRTLELSTTPYPSLVSVHTVPLDDKHLISEWGANLYQIRMRFEEVPRRGRCVTLIRQESDISGALESESS